MNAGRLRFHIEVQEPIESRNTVGEITKTWAFKEKVWAAIDPLRGDELMTMRQVKPTVDTKITMRGNAAPYLTAKNRLVYKTRVFDIDAIIDWQSRGIMKEVHCKEQA